MVEAPVKPTETRIGPALDRNPVQPNSSHTEDRDVHFIELDANKDGLPFSYMTTIQNLRKTFPDSDYLSVLSGGSGNGAELGDIKSIGESLDIPIKTTAITLASRNAARLQEEHVDHIIIDSIQNAFKEKKIQPESYHFISDIAGAISYDDTWTPDMQIGKGEAIIPVYARLLAPGGKLLFTAPQLTTRLEALLAENHLLLTQKGNHYFMAEKDPEYTEENPSDMTFLDNLEERKGIDFVWKHQVATMRRRNTRGIVMGYGFSTYASVLAGADEQFQQFQKTLHAERADTHRRSGENILARERFLVELGIDASTLEEQKNGWKQEFNGDKKYWYHATQDPDLFLVRYEIPSPNGIVIVLNESLVRVSSVEELKNIFS